MPAFANLGRGGRRGKSFDERFQPQGKRFERLLGRIAIWRDHGVARLASGLATEFVEIVGQEQGRKEQLSHLRQPRRSLPGLFGLRIHSARQARQMGLLTVTAAHGVAPAADDDLDISHAP